MNRIVQSIRLLFIVVSLALGAAFLGGCREGSDAARPSAADSIAKAPSLQVLLDVSASSPALDPQLMASVAPRVAALAKSLPVGSWVSINTIGDATLPSSLLRMQIQARGTTASDVARQLQRFLRDFPAQAKDKAQGRSDLVGGFAAAAAYINRQSDANAVVAVSDLVEYSSLADCSRGRRCVLPAKPSFDLSGARVQVYGVGQGLPSPQAMQLTEDWRAFLTRAKASDIDLRRF